MDQALPSIEARSAKRQPYPEEVNAPEHRTLGLRLREGPLFGCGSLVRQHPVDFEKLLNAVQDLDDRTTEKIKSIGVV